MKRKQNQRSDRRTGNSREDILKAAIRVSAREGSGHVTLDAVAREAGVSKGGLLYNFPTKEAMIAGMLARLLEEFEQAFAQCRESLAGEPNPTLRAYIRASLMDDCLDPETANAILAGVAEKPELLNPLRSHYEQTWAQVRSECRDEAKATLLWAAADGLVFWGLFRLMPMNSERLKGLADTLDAWAREEF